MDESHILCGKCRVPVEIFGSEYHPIVRCPKCNEADTLDEARREAGKHAAYQFIQRALTRLSDPKPSVSFRFIEDLWPDRDS